MIHITSGDRRGSLAGERPAWRSHRWRDSTRLGLSGGISFAEYRAGGPPSVAYPRRPPGRRLLAALPEDEEMSSGSTACPLRPDDPRPSPRLVRSPAGRRALS